jgi:hypothetical protein
MKLQAKTLRYIGLSELNLLGNNVDIILDSFVSYEGHDYTWGNNNHTLIDQATFLNTLKDSIDSASDGLSEAKAYSALDTVRNALRGLPKEAYIDLEN